MLVGTKEKKQEPVPDEADMSLQKVLTELPSSGLEGRGLQAVLDQWLEIGLEGSGLQVKSIAHPEGGRCT